MRKQKRTLTNQTVMRIFIPKTYQKPRKKKSTRQKKIDRLLKLQRADRKSKRYHDWRKRVLKRDKYTCQDCGVKGKNVILHAHHIVHWADDITKRFKRKNGLTLCIVCHVSIHPWMRRNKQYKDVPYKKTFKTVTKPQKVIVRKVE